MTSARTETSPFVFGKVDISVPSHTFRYHRQIMCKKHRNLICKVTIQAISWKAQVRLCKRYRQLMAKGKNANQVVVAIARELSAFMWAIAKQVAKPPQA
jgi:transposase